MTKSRIFLFLLLAFVVGVAIRSFLSVPYLFLWLTAIISAIVVALGIIRRAPKVIVIGFTVVALIIGIIRYDTSESSRPDLASLYGQPLSTTGIVIEEPESSLSAQRLKVKIDNFYILVTTRRHPEYVLGDEVDISGLLERPTNLGEFDYISFLAKDDIYAVMSFPQINLVGKDKGDLFKQFLSRAKIAFEKKIDLALPEPHSSFLKGLLLGERESFSEEFKENLSRTGTTHIVALSGYNITLVSRFFILGLLLLTIPYQVSFWIATLAVILFIILTGASPSVVRAGIMGILILVAEREGRMYQIRNALVFAAAVMIFQNPKILRFDAAFQLSFLATLGLIYGAPLLEEKFIFWKSRLKKNYFAKKGTLSNIEKILVETISAQIFVLPLIVFLFGIISLVSPFVNVLVLVAVPYAMFFGFLAGVAGFLEESTSRVLGFVVWALLEYIVRVIQFFARIPGASIELGTSAVSLFLLFSLFVFWKLKKTRVRLPN